MDVAAIGKIATGRAVMAAFAQGGLIPVFGIYKHTYILKMNYGKVKLKDSNPFRCYMTHYK